VIAGRDRPLEDGDLLLSGQGARVVLLIVLNGTVEHEQSSRQSKRAAHVVLEDDRRARATDTARKNGVAQQAEPGMAAPDLLL
jgi:hypothetical protein